MIANLADLLTAAAERAAGAVALVEADTGREITWSELEGTVARVAGGLDELGLVAGNRVAISTANRPEFLVAYLATLRARLVAVPVNPRSTEEELGRTVDDSGARLLIADRTTVQAARAVRQGSAGSVRLAVIGAADTAEHDDEIDFADLETDTPHDLPAARDPESLAVLLYTSGTSARPRAAMLSHRALLANLAQAARVEPPMVRADDVVYGVLPLFHVYGLNAVFGQVLHQRACLVVAESFDPVRSLDHVARHGVTVLPVAPAVLAHWRQTPDAADKLATVRTLMSGSAPLSPELISEFTEVSGLAVHQGYGLTEAAPVVTSTLCSKGQDSGPKAGSVGAPLPGVQVRLVDETGATPEGADPGEILVAGDNLFDGYWPDAADGPVDGWFATGDVGFLDPDGDLFLVDRLKELIIVSGFNVYPSEIEDVLTEVEGVAEAAVLGEPDEETGEAVVAFVSPAPGSDLAPEALEARVREACERRLARFKQPSRIEVVDRLPHTVTGKIARGTLRSTVRRAGLGLVE